MYRGILFKRKNKENKKFTERLLHQNFVERWNCEKAFYFSIYHLLYCLIFFFNHEHTLYFISKGEGKFKEKPVQRCDHPLAWRMDGRCAVGRLCLAQVTPFSLARRLISHLSSEIPAAFMNIS